MLKTMIVLLLATSAVSAEDSPLVALAKRTNRKASKTPVITNEMVARSQGRLSMAGGESAKPVPVVAPSAPPPPDRPRFGTQGAGAATAVSGYPQSTAGNVEPQSSAQTVNPESTARTMDPSSAAGSIAPQSSAQTVNPESTAQNVPPQTGTPPQ